MAAAESEIAAKLIERLLAAFFAIGLTLRYKPVMDNYAPDYVVWSVLITLWVVFFIPVLIMLVKPLWERVRGSD